MNKHQEQCKHEFVGLKQCCYCGYLENDKGEIVFPSAAANLKQLSDDFSKWYFGIKEESGKPPLAMQIFWWFSERMECRISEPKK